MRMRRFLTLVGVVLAAAVLSWGGYQVALAQYVPPPVLVPTVDYMKPNYANSPVLTKFKDALPGLAAPGAAGNTLGNYIPLAVPMGTSTPAGVPRDGDYYEIAVVDFLQQLHSDMPPTKLRGYVQIEPPGSAQPAGSRHVALTYPGGGPVLFNGVQVYGYDRPLYLGPVIASAKGTPTRIKFYNLLHTTATGGNLFIPTDVTVMGAGLGPDGTNSYSENRATLHLHGGDNPWISDGTAHQWITPAGETANATYAKGASQQNVPDMPVPPSGTATFFWPNGESGRLMFYHDHAYGMTRLDVYAGEAAGYLLVDPNERALNAAYAPGGEIPLVIQDKAFVSDGTTPAGFPPAGTAYTAPAATTAVDPLWNGAVGSSVWGKTKGSLWFPHIYMPNQNPNDISGASVFGRWDYGPWFWPIFPVSDDIPETSIVPETFVDTPMVNGSPYPFLPVTPTTYRFRILNACNDRYLNLQLYAASTIVSQLNLTGGGSGYTVAPAVTFTNAAGDTTGKGASAEAVIDTTVGSPTFGQVTELTLISVGSGYTAAPTVTISPPAAGTAATATALIYTALTEVGMVPADPSAPIAFPSWWTENDTPGMIPNVLDNRPGGVPDPGTIGPSFIHIGSEGGIAPQAVELKNTPIGYEQNKRSVTVLNTYEHTLFLGPAERADVLVDFSQFAGKTLILYNDAPAPLPAGDPRNDYYTADPDNTFQGGAPSTAPGFGPNTRTIMQIQVAATPVGTPLNVTALNTAVGAAFTATQPAPIVTVSPTPVYSRISDTSLIPNGAPQPIGSITLTSGGSGYKSVPKVRFTGGNPTTPATATAIVTGGVITGVNIINPGVGYKSAPLVSFIGGRPTTPAIAVATLATAMPMQPKTIQELFDDLGRMNATLGVEVPFTSAAVQTTIPYGFVDPATEVIPDGATQLWKITHNGVDTHAIHFHLFNVQVVNRIGWDGAIKPPWPEELGWKETVKMNPLEDIVVALKAKVPTVPATMGSLPDNFRLLDVANPVGSTVGFFGVDPNGNPVTVVNQMANFGHEYTWHCHLLGHEENDMMRPMSVAVAPAAPSNLAVSVNALGAVLNWTNNAPNANVIVQRATNNTFTTGLTVFNLGNVSTYTDTSYNPTTAPNYYRVAATNTVGSGVAGFPSITNTSGFSNIANTPVPAGPPRGVTNLLSLTQAKLPSRNITLTWTYSLADQTGFTVQRALNSTFTSQLTTFAVGNVTTYTDTTSKIAGLRYYYRVIPTNASGNGAASNTRNILSH
jgi:FtsP/CotA-like multicopper oxidase with cupredoxin domain